MQRSIKAAEADHRRRWAASLCQVLRGVVDSIPGYRSCQVRHAVCSAGEFNARCRPIEFHKSTNYVYGARDFDVSRPVVRSDHCLRPKKPQRLAVKEISLFHNMLQLYLSKKDQRTRDDYVINEATQMNFPSGRNVRLLLHFAVSSRSVDGNFGKEPCFREVQLWCKYVSSERCSSSRTSRRLRHSNCYSYSGSPANAHDLVRMGAGQLITGYKSRQLPNFLTALADNNMNVNHDFMSW